jgi:hypothetical protein
MATIREHSKRCFQLFTDCSNAVSQQELDAAEKVKIGVKDEFSRFRLWLSNIGVFAELQLSLDFRVRDAPDIKDLFLKQLDIIETRLQQRMIPSAFPIALRRSDRRTPLAN